jgi:hypothetical protein
MGSSSRFSLLIFILQSLLVYAEFNISAKTNVAVYWVSLGWRKLSWLSAC